MSVRKEQSKVSVVQIFILQVLKSDTASSCETTQNIVMDTELERKFFEICDIMKALADDRQTLVGRLENIEKKYNILQDLWQRSREELKDAQFKIDQLETALLDGTPNVITIVDPTQSPSPSVLKEEDSDSSSISTINSDMSHSVENSSTHIEEADVHEEIKKLKTKQAKLSSKLQYLTDSASERTLILSNIDLRIPTNTKYSKLALFPVISSCLRVRGLGFLLFGCMDIDVFKTGTLKIIYDSRFRLRKVIQQMRWLRRNANSTSHTIPQCHVLKKMVFSQSTPSHFNRDRRTLQKIGLGFKKEGLWSHFDFVIKWIDTDQKILLLRGWVRNQAEGNCVYFDTNRKQYYF